MKVVIRAIELMFIGAVVTTFLGGNTSFGRDLPDRHDRIDPDRMTLTFDENFDELDVSARGPGSRWIAHTPWDGDFGGAKFVDPEKGFPFTIDKGVLRIEASKDEEGEWRGGLLASVDPTGQGFAQKYGYFEIRARLPVEPGVWPAFWLIGEDRSETTAEIDVFEFYGTKPEGFSSSAHVWRRPEGDHTTGARSDVYLSASPADFHTYGVLIDPAWIRVYFDRRLVWQTPTEPEHRQPMYMLLDLGMVDNDRLLSLSETSFMYVDYVRAYK